MNNELTHKKGYVSALTMPAITQCKPNENLISCNGKLKKKINSHISLTPLPFALYQRSSPLSLQNSATDSSHRNISIFQ